MKKIYEYKAEDLNEHCIGMYLRSTSEVEKIAEWKVLEVNQSGIDTLTIWLYSDVIPGKGRLDNKHTNCWTFYNGFCSLANQEDIKAIETKMHLICNPPLVERVARLDLVCEE